MRRGEVWLVRLDPTVGDEIGKIRPVVIVNDNEVGILKLNFSKVLQYHFTLIAIHMHLVERAASYRTGFVSRFL